MHAHMCVCVCVREREREILASVNQFVIGASMYSSSLLQVFFML
jgi:hypothetical protein